jgi:hypothetical protein
MKYPLALLLLCALASGSSFAKCKLHLEAPTGSVNWRLLKSSVALDRTVIAIGKINGQGGGDYKLTESKQLMVLEETQPQFRKMSECLFATKNLAALDALNDYYEFFANTAVLQLTKHDVLDAAGFNKWIGAMEWLMTEKYRAIRERL